MHKLIKLLKKVKKLPYCSLKSSCLTGERLKMTCKSSPWECWKSKKIKKNSVYGMPKRKGMSEAKGPDKTQSKKEIWHIGRER